MIESIIILIRILAELLFLLVIASVILSFFMSPYHTVRQTIDRIVEPFLAPIRRVVPTVGMIDFSPLVLIILIHVLQIALLNMLRHL